MRIICIFILLISTGISKAQNTQVDLRQIRPNPSAKKPISKEIEVDESSRIISKIFISGHQEEATEIRKTINNLSQAQFYCGVTQVSSFSCQMNTTNCQLIISSERCVFQKHLEPCPSDKNPRMAPEPLRKRVTICIPASHNTTGSDESGASGKK